MQLEKPQEYFKGIGCEELSAPTNVLLFHQTTRKQLQIKVPLSHSHHPRFVLIFNLLTKGFVHLDAVGTPLAPGQALLIQPYQFHHYSHINSLSLQWVFCTFELSHKVVFKLLKNRSIDIGENTQRTFVELLNEWHQPSSSLQGMQVQAVLLRLLLSLVQDYESTSVDQPYAEQPDSLIRSVHHLMTKWHGQPVIVADLAEAMNYSESRLRVLFKETAGIPIGRYIHNYRIHHAMTLLRDTDHPISYIAEEAGFGSPQAFSQIFKKAVGQTPRAYRLKQSPSSHRGC